MKYLRYIIVVLLLICPIILDAQRNIPLCIEQINSLPANSDKDTYEMLLKEFAKSGGNIKDIGNGILNATNNGNIIIIPILSAISQDF